MDKKKLSKIKESLEEYWDNPKGIKSGELVGIAKKLGRTRSKRGKEPNYVRESDPDLRPLSIPSHPGDLKPGTARSIIGSLLNDVDEWELFLFGGDDED